MAVVELNVKPRVETGKGAARKARRDGRIPAVLYGDTVKKGVALLLEAADFRHVIQRHAGENVVLDLKVEGEAEARKAIVREVQYHPFRSEALHVDFLQVDLSKPVEVEVTVHVTGVARGVKEQGGVLDVQFHEIPIECKPLDIPSEITVDVSELMIGDAIKVGDLTVPNVEILAEMDRTIVSVAPPTVAKAEEEEAAEGEEGEEPEVVGEKKEGEEGESEGSDKDKDKD
jgi:large subunit ribosomal protein L25